MRKAWLIFILILSAVAVANAQDFLSWKLSDRYFSGQATFGFASYRGELKHNGSIQNEVSNISLGLEARLWSRIAARIEIGRYNIRGHDKHASDSSFYRQRNLSFSAVNYEASVQGIFFMKKYAGDYYKRPQLDPYLLAGLGLTMLNPKTEMAGNNYNLWEYPTEDVSYSRWTMIIPLGAGLKWRISPFLNFNTEITYRYTFSDYLDDVSGNYSTSDNIVVQNLSNRKNEIDIVNEEAYDLMVPGSPRGDNSDKDAYLFLNFKFEFFLPPDMFSKKE